MKTSPRGLMQMILVAIFFIVTLGLGYWWQTSGRLVQLSTDKAQYLHFDFVDLTLRSHDPGLDKKWSQSPPRVCVLRDGHVVTTIAGIRDMTMQRDRSGDWVARWPVPWNAPDGEYVPALIGADDLSERLKTSSFRITRRKPKPLPPGFAALTLESAAPLAEMKIKAPDGTMKDWHGLLDWAVYMGVDALWVLGGQSPGKEKGQIWVENNLKLLPGVAAECHARGLQFGVYAMYSLTTSSIPIAGYEYGLDIKDSRPVPTRAVSIRDRKRLDDVANLLRPWAIDPNVDFIGVDYIRNALGGYELADDFVAEMPGIRVPAQWPTLSREERMTWVARKKIMRLDDAFIDAWQWWRARRVALIVKELKKHIGDQKIFWAFTLTWDKGWHHGQDPVMMNDAGMDYDALMFYEADKAQYEAMLNDWHGYASRSDVQLMPGNIFDWVLHQKDPEGPKEFSRRMNQALARVYRDGPAQGLFFHDAMRLQYRRLGSWGALGWADEARALTRALKSRTQRKDNNQ